MVYEYTLRTENRIFIIIPIVREAVSKSGIINGSVLFIALIPLPE